MLSRRRLRPARNKSQASSSLPCRLEEGSGAEYAPEPLFRGKVVSHFGIDAQHGLLFEEAAVVPEAESLCYRNKIVLGTMQNQDRKMPISRRGCCIAEVAAADLAHCAHLASFERKRDCDESTQRLAEQKDWRARRLLFRPCQQKTCGVEKLGRICNHLRGRGQARAVQHLEVVGQYHAEALPRKRLLSEVIQSRFDTRLCCIQTRGAVQHEDEAERLPLHGNVLFHENVRAFDFNVRLNILVSARTSESSAGSA